MAIVFARCAAVAVAMFRVARSVVCAAWMFWRARVAGTKHVQKTRGKARSFKNGAEQYQAAAGVVAMGEHFQKIAELGILAKAPGAFEKPKVELVGTDGKTGNQFRVKAFGIVDQKAGMNFEEAGEQFSRAFGHVGPGAIFDLRQIRLAESAASFAAGSNDDFGLSHVSAEAAEHSLGASEVADFVAEFHSTPRFQLAI